MDYVWICRCCGRQFDTLPLDFAYEPPDHWFQLSEQERQERAKLSRDVCIIDGRDLFVRGCIENFAFHAPNPAEQEWLAGAVPPFVERLENAYLRGEVLVTR